LFALSAGVVALIVAALILLPHLVDTPAVKRALEQRAARAVQGEVSWRELELRLFPLPYGLLRGARVDVPGALAASVEQIEVELRLWPLLHGHLEISSVRVVQPALHLQLPASRQARSGESDALAAYRAALRPTVDAIQRFMPGATLVLEGARIDVAEAPIGPLAIDLRISVDGDGIDVDGTADGAYWKRVSFAARIESADLAAKVTADASGVKLQNVLDKFVPGAKPHLRVAEAGAGIEVRTDGRQSIEATFRAELPSAHLLRGNRQLAFSEVLAAGTARHDAKGTELVLTHVRLGDLVPSAQATLRLAAPRNAAQASLHIAALDVVRLRDAALALAGDEAAVRDYAPRIGGGKLADLRLSARAGHLDSLFRLSHLQGSLTLKDGALRLPILEQQATGIGAHVQMVGGLLKARGMSARLGASQLADAAAEIALQAPVRVDASGARASLAIDELAAWLKAQGKLAGIEDISGTAEATLHRLQVRFDRPETLAYDVSVRPRQLRLRVGDYPAATFDGGVLRITPDVLKIDGVSAAALDAAARVSGTVGVLAGKHPRGDARVEAATAGGKAIDWVWQRAALPAPARPATPLRLEAPRVQWSAAGLDATVAVEFPTGLKAGAEVALRGAALDLRRLTLKDAESDALLSFSQRGSLIEAAFAGVLSDRSVASMLAEPPRALSGSASGDLQVRFDRDHPAQASARGRLSAQRIQLGALLPYPVTVERAELEVDGRTLRVRELTMSQAGQRATLRGDVSQQASGLAVQAEVDSPGIDVDTLLPTSATTDGTLEPARNKGALWPLPLSGNIAVHAGFVQYQGRRIQSLRATLALQPRRAQIRVAHAALCGIDFPLSFAATPEHMEFAVRLQAKDQELETVAHCLTRRGILISGRFDLTAELQARGTRDQLLGDLKGPIDLAARNGEIRKFALVGNVLSLTDVAGLLERKVQLDRDGFRYRGIAARGRIGAGRFTLEQGSLDSEALGLAATGHIEFDFQSKLTMLVAPFGNVDRIVRGIPIVGYVVGGVFTSIPVGVSGDIRDPRVVPLGPEAVSGELLGIFERTLKLPARLITPFKGKPAAQ
jgi:uncharacterized protein involved in outer membrane biogenesis